MTVEVNNLRLYDDFKDFSKFQNQIEQCKVNFLLKLSKLYQDAQFVFYNILGELALIENVEKLLGSIFKNYEISYEPAEVDFNSSPIDNKPIIQIDKALVTVEGAETIGLRHTSDLHKLSCDYTKCFYVLETPTNEKVDENIQALFVEIDPKNFMESELISGIEDVGARYLTLKLLRGEKVCF